MKDVIYLGNKIYFYPSESMMEVSVRQRFEANGLKLIKENKNFEIYLGTKWICSVESILSANCFLAGWVSHKESLEPVVVSGQMGRKFPERCGAKHPKYDGVTCEESEGHCSQHRGKSSYILDGKGRFKKRGWLYWEEENSNEQTKMEASK